MPFCQNCGKELNEGAKFCEGCGQALGSVQTTSTVKEEAEKVILEAKGSLAGGGTGKIILTNKHIMWNKSATNFAMVGLASLITKGSTAVSISDILSIDTFVFLGGAGLQLLANNGKNINLDLTKKQTEILQCLIYNKKYHNRKDNKYGKFN